MTLALPVFDPEKHHVGLGEQGQTQYGLMITGGYRKAFQRAEQVPVAFGGSPPTPIGPVNPIPPASAPPSPSPIEPVPPPVPPSPVPTYPIQPISGPMPSVVDLITDAPGSTNWTQNDFSGGAFQFNWLKDAAMFLTSSNMAPMTADTSLRTVPPVISVATATVESENPIYVFATQGNIITVIQGNKNRGGTQQSGIVRVVASGGARTFHPIVDGTNVNGIILGACFDSAEQVLYVCQDGLGGGIIQRVRMDNITTKANGVAPDFCSKQFYQGPASAHGDEQAFGMCISGGQMVVCWGRHPYGNASTLPLEGLSVWTGTLPEDRNVANSPEWTRCGALAGNYKDSVPYNGRVYVLTSTLDRGTQLVAVDPASGSAVPVADFPYNFQGECLKVYGGRLYVGGSATDIGSTVRFAELHEVTGNSIRLVRSFGPESKNSAMAMQPDALYTMEAYEGFLWFGQTGSQLICYDLTTDGFFGASALPANAEVRKAFAFRERLYLYLKFPSSATSDGWYRIAVSGDTVTSYSGQVITSDFAPYLDELKDWVKLRVMTRYGGVTLDVSQDGGSTWTAVAGTQTQDGNNYLTNFDLSAVADGYRIRLRLTMLRGTSAGGFTELVAFTLAYNRPKPPAPVNTVTPAVMGIPEKRQFLWVDLGTWTNQPTQYKIQWRRCDAAGANCANVGGNTLNYELTKADVGKTIRIVVTAINAGGQAQATSLQVGPITEPAAEVNLPQAEFTASRVYGGLPFTVAFTDLTAYDRATSWDWDFGDGTAHSSAQHPYHEYTNPGTYTVTLTATNSAGSSVKVKTGYITVKRYVPQPEFTASAVYGRAPLTIAFTDLSDYDRPTSWLWNFGDGNTSTDQHPFHTYTTPGTYTVSLQATNAAGAATKTKTNYIKIEPKLPDKHGWSFTVVGAERVEALDSETEHYNLELLRDELWRFIDSDLILTLTDVEGNTWPCKLVKLDEFQPEILPGVTVPDPLSTASTTDKEGFFQLTLLEYIP